MSHFTAQKVPDKLIVVEGVDGSGKSTQITLLRKFLESEGFPVVFTEWNSSELVRETTRRSKKKQSLTPSTFSLLHATDFAHRFHHHILPPLKAGMLVLADRYAFTAYARDVVRGVDPAWVRNLYRFAVKPDVTLYFRVPIDVAMKRILSGRPKIKYYEAGMDLGFSSNVVDSFRMFQTKILETYDGMTKECDFDVIDASKPVAEQQKLVRQHVFDALKTYKGKRQNASPPRVYPERIR